jgi:hypothetical protein
MINDLLLIIGIEECRSRFARPQKFYESVSPGVGYNYPDTKNILAVLAAERRHAYGDYSIGHS